MFVLSSSDSRLKGEFLSARASAKRGREPGLDWHVSAREREVGTSEQLATGANISVFGVIRFAAASGWVKRELPAIDNIADAVELYGGGCELAWE